MIKANFYYTKVITYYLPKSIEYDKEELKFKISTEPIEVIDPFLDKKEYKPIFLFSREMKEADLDILLKNQKVHVENQYYTILNAGMNEQGEYHILINKREEEKLPLTQENEETYLKEIMQNLNKQSNLPKIIYGFLNTFLYNYDGITFKEKTLFLCLFRRYLLDYRNDFGCYDREDYTLVNALIEKIKKIIGDNTLPKYKIK